MIEKRYAVFCKYLFISLIALMIWYINHCAPMMNDDYLYATYMGTDFSPGLPNKSWSDVFRSCLHHYFLCNGRMANNFAFILFYLGDKTLFNVATCIVSVAGLVALSKVFMKRVTVFSLSFTILSCILLLPALYHTCVWCDGAFNYLWAASILVVALFMLQRSRTSDGLDGRLSFCVACFLLFVAASMHEMLGVNMVGTSILWLLWSLYKHRSVPGWCVWAIVFVVLGALIPLTSPGIHERAGRIDYFSWKFVLTATAEMFRHTWCALCVCVGLLLYHAKKRNVDILGIFACVAGFFAWAVGMHNFVGCAHFYFSFAVVMWMLHTISPWLFDYHAWVKAGVVVVTATIMCFFCHVSCRINQTIELAFQLAQKNEIVVLDVDPINHTESIAHVSGLPINALYIYPYLGKYHGIRDFMVIQRSCVGDTDVYKTLLAAESHSVASCRTKDGWTYIRFPKNKLCCIFAGLTLHGQSQTKIRVSVCPFMKFLHADLFALLYDNHIAKQRFIHGSLDYYEGYVFALIPPTEEVSSCEFKMLDLRTRDSFIHRHAL